MKGTLSQWKFKSIRVIPFGTQLRRINTLDPINLNEAKFDKLLIANRGEIACRIISTAKMMGIKTVAVYSTVDSQSKHVKLADEAVLIGGANATESYLNIDKLFEVLRLTGADSIHPGYGFLSENANFVELVEKMGVTFIGPSSASITKMGDKLKSKRLATLAGVSTIPGYDGIIENENQCVSIAKELGYPVMIKASAGGGGKGMRIASDDKAASEGFRMASQEALSSFADKRILVEKYIVNPRHIEIQVLGDKHGSAVHFYERECSIQRRHQKVIEEAPSTFLDEATRENMGKQAVALCKQIAYSSAGTVEFLIDSQRNFYFLEMNTRLQVEHPVTECVTGVDLVQQMLRVAKGHKLNFVQEDIKTTGWAIESRVYAEDPYKNFGTPSIGRLNYYKEPENVRCDSGIEEGSEISIYYDAMISKLISHGLTREDAVAQNIQALDSYVIRGVAHNIPLLRDILTEPRFTKGDISTNYLKEVYGSKFTNKDLAPNEIINILSIASSLYVIWKIKNRTFLNESIDRVVKPPKNWELVINFMDRKYYLVAKKEHDKMTVTIDGSDYVIDGGLNLSQPIIKTKINDELVVMQLLSKNPNGDFQITYKGTVYKLNIIPKRAADLYHHIKAKPKKDVSKLISAPMPGLVKSVTCKVGEMVMSGEQLCVIEAMKMQNAMYSPAQGMVKRVNVKVGDAVGEDDVLVELE